MGLMRRRRQRNTSSETADLQSSPRGGQTIKVDDKTFTAGKDYIPRNNNVFGAVRPFDGAEVITAGV